jgi:hypothetical protein
MKMKSESRQESSKDYESVVFTKDNYRVIIGRESSRYHKQYVVQKFKGGRYRNLSYHYSFDSIPTRYKDLTYG